MNADLQLYKQTYSEKWVKIEGYPKLGDYVRTTWRNRTYEGLLTGTKIVCFRTGFVAREITTKEGYKRWMPWTSRAQYLIKK